MTDRVVLRFVGEPGQWLPAVPARDITDDDVHEFGLDLAALRDSGLYVTPGTKAAEEFDAMHDFYEEETEEERVARVMATDSAPAQTYTVPAEPPEEETPPPSARREEEAE